jgi:hypothetical protein
MENRELIIEAVFPVILRGRSMPTLSNWL